MVELAGRILPVHPSEGPVAGRDEKVTDVQRVCNELQQLPEDCVTGLHGYVCNWAVRRGLKCGGTYPVCRTSGTLCPSAAVTACCVLCAGQGVVVFVPQTVRRDPLAEARAMKIFAQPEPFAEEIRVYTNQDINGFMPYIFEYGFKARTPPPPPSRSFPPPIRDLIPVTVHVNPDHLLSKPWFPDSPDH